jgi:ubiquitin carboxyl-terminal hydrolase L3
MNPLAHKLGLSPSVSFHDVYSLTEPDLVAILPRPALALLFIYPCTESSDKWYAEERAQDTDYESSGTSDPVLFYPQIITHACGLIGLLHSVTNGAASQIEKGSDLSSFMDQVIPLKPMERAQLIHDSDILEKAHAEAAQTGDSTAPPLGDDPGHAFIAFVKGKDGNLYELDGARKGPVNRGHLDEDEDVLSEKALNLGPLPYMKREEEAGSGVLRFHCTVLAPSNEQ